MSKRLQLVVLAAGLGRRFGGDKQVAEVGPSGEWLLDYALHDARLAGFSEAVLVVRPGMDDLATRSFPHPVKLAFQNEQLGTAHALWSARTKIKDPFAVVNADDFYGRECYVQIAEFLSKDCRPGHYALVGFPLERTLSDSGPVSRAVCKVDDDGYLEQIEERQGLTKGDASLPLNAPVSMNCWGFQAAFLDFLEQETHSFLQNRTTKELFLPHLVGEAMKKQNARIKVIPTRSEWMGMTFASDLDRVKGRIREMVSNGIYPVKVCGPEF